MYQYRIASLSDLLIKFQPSKDAFAQMRGFCKLMEESANNSRLNFLFQCTNLIIIWLLILITLPSHMEAIVDQYLDVDIFFIPFPRMTFAIVSYSFLWVLSLTFEVSWSNLFETSPMVTFVLSLLLFLICAFLYKSIVVALYRKIKNDARPFLTCMRTKLQICKIGM